MVLGAAVEVAGLVAEVDTMETPRASFSQSLSPDHFTRAIPMSMMGLNAGH